MGVPPYIKGVVMEQSIEVGSIWIDKSGENPVIVLAYNKQRQSVSFTYLLTINGKLDLTEAFSSVDLFLKTKELMVTSSTANTEYVNGKADGYDEGYQNGFTLAKEKLTKLDEKGSKRIYNDGYKDGHNDCREELRSYMYEKELVANNEGYEEGYNKAIEEMKSEKFNSSICSSNAPNKETQEATQEILDKYENDFAGIWVSKHHNPDWKIEYYSDCGTHVWMRVLGVPSLTAYVVGDLFTIPKERLKSDYTKILEDNSVENTPEYDQLEKELKLVEKYPHYYKDIRHLNIIDIYRFFDLFEVTDPCIQHSTKKLAVGGKRGAKDYEKDIKEAMDTLKRWEYMQEENKRGLDD